MNIKEAETRAGLARANIRYYEDQGFLSPARGENGYRNYSDQDVDTLLKIKLLRQLGFSLEEIHQLQSGQQALEPALERREAGLERESRELSQAAGLCRAMREDGADFYTLDARRYLDRLAQGETAVEQDRDPVRVFPWRRYFARCLDDTLYRTLITVALQLFARANILRIEENTGSRFLLGLGVLALMLAAETLSLALTGTTPGKALLGLRVLREDGSRLSFEEAGRRTAYVVAFYGLSQALIGSGVLLFSIGGAAMLIWACWQAYHERPLFWEADQLYLDGSTKERTFWENRRNLLRAAGYAAITAACVGLMVGGHFLAAMPPHLGPELTAEEFVDNYNRFMAFTYGEENLTRYLTPEGIFEEKPDDGAVIHLFGESPVPDARFSFGQGGGLTKIVLTQAYDSGGPLAGDETYAVSIPYDEIYAAMRSFLWGQLGSKGTYSLYEALVEQEGNYHTVLDGVRVDSEMRFTGYVPFIEDTLFAQEGEPQSYFVEFTMELT